VDRSFFPANASIALKLWITRSLIFRTIALLLELLTILEWTSSFRSCLKNAREENNSPDALNKINS
jgi:hypothetical protein